MSRESTIVNCRFESDGRTMIEMCAQGGQPIMLSNTVINIKSNGTVFDLGEGDDNINFCGVNMKARELKACLEYLYKITKENQPEDFI